MSSLFALTMPSAAQSGPSDVPAPCSAWTKPRLPKAQLRTVPYGPQLKTRGRWVSIADTGIAGRIPVTMRPDDVVFVPDPTRCILVPHHLRTGRLVPLLQPRATDSVPPRRAYSRSL